MDKISSDKNYRYRDMSRATILTTCRPRNGRWVVVSMNEKGAIRFHDAYGFEKDNTCDDLIEVCEWAHIKSGDVVEVRDSDTEIWRLRRFSKTSAEGLPLTFHGSGVGLIQWQQCRLVCAQENEEWRRE